MAEFSDPETLLEWLSLGQGEERDMQLIALEQLCMLLLMSDNVDKIFECCPPRTFLNALCRIFLDETAPESVLEVTARALTYYLDVSAECTRRIVSVDGAIKAICNKLAFAEVSSRTSKDLSEQCIKVLELICTREAGAVFEAGGLNSVLAFIRDNGNLVHKDTLHSSMSVVSRLCSKMEPQDPKLGPCVESLSTLLRHEDSHVADGSLKCFASLSDRFTRRGVDPAPLAEHGLIKDLLMRMSTALGSPSSTHGNQTKGATSNNTSLLASSATTSATNTPSEQGKFTASVSTIISLLSTLCRGSPSITDELLRSLPELPEALDKALKGDERCILDTMRLVDLLMVLLFEGRKSLPKSTSSIASARLASLRQDATGDKTHRQLIDCIRSKDTDALIEALESGRVEVNFMDDVGQTLLNWASAFGTQEMVEFLCEKGADTNKGQRSSSLHYASCFGRPTIAKTLLKYGANPDLRDEDGKTPLDKARERNDEGHRAVAAILQSPAEFMCSQTSSERRKSESSDEVFEPENEMAPIYLQKLLPIFCSTYHSTIIPSVKRGSLNIIKKMIHYISSTLLTELCNPESPNYNLGTLIVEVIAAVLDNDEDDDDGHLLILNMIKDLMIKSQEIFIEHFARLGVFNKVLALCPNDPPAEIKKEDTPERENESTNLEDAKEIIAGRPYHWRDFSICRGRDCVYIWNETAALELSFGSNGWFRFILDNKLATMYSSGSPEGGGSESSESRSEFIEKLQIAKSSIKANQQSTPILSTHSSIIIKVGNWALSSKKDGELNIQNTDGQQQTLLKEDLAGFLFTSNRGTKHQFTAETQLGPEFNPEFTLSGKKGKRLKSKHEALKQKIKSLAQEIYEGYFQAVQSQPRGVVAKLGCCVANIERACYKQDGHRDEVSWQQLLKMALEELTLLLKDFTSVSAYELHSSGLIQALIRLLTSTNPEKDYETYFGKLSRRRRNAMLQQRIEIFKSCFRERNIDGTKINPAESLVKKLVSVLENIEKLPVLLYESSGANYGLQVLTRRLRFRLEKSSSENSLLDRSGRTLGMEPLTTITQLENYLLKMICRQWYDYDRSSFTFVRKLKEISPIVFQYRGNDFDENGILYWIGTNAKTQDCWVNPAQYGLVIVSSSEGKNLPYGQISDILNRDASALNCHTNDDKRAWFGIDLGLFVLPTTYTLRHARGYGRSALRNWNFQMSKDGNVWTTLLAHNDDCSLNEPGSTKSWHINTVSENETHGWRYVRLQISGKNASGQTYYLSLSGFEIYGKVTAVCEDLGKARDMDASLRKQRRLIKSQVKQMTLGARVMRGIDWKWGDQDHVGNARNFKSQDPPGKDGLESQLGTVTNTSELASDDYAYENKYYASDSVASNLSSNKANSKSSSKLSSNNDGKVNVLTSVLTSRKSSSTSSLPEATENNSNVAKQISSSEQSSSADMLNQMAELMTEKLMTESVLSTATQMDLSESVNNVSFVGGSSDELHPLSDLATLVEDVETESVLTVDTTSEGSGSSSPKLTRQKSTQKSTNLKATNNMSSMKVDIDPRMLYDETEFLNSLKNGKNALLAAGRPNSSSATKTSGKTNLGIDVSDLGPPALKDVMKMIALSRRNIKLEENEASTSGGKSRRTLAWLGGKSTESQSSKKEVNETSLKLDNIESAASNISNSKCVSSPNLSSPESSSLSTTPTSVFCTNNTTSNNNLNNATTSNNSLFDGLSAIARVRSLINSSRFPSLSHNNPSTTSQMLNNMNPSASNPATYHHHHNRNQNNNDLNQNANNAFLFGRATPHSVSSLNRMVRIALSSNFPGGLLSTAQSYPSLSSNNNANNSSNVSALGQQQYTSSDSEQDFLETCRATTLLAELDDDELPEEDDNDDENENEDDYLYEEAALNLKDDECYEVRSGRKRMWDDEFVLKRQFSALLPPFDPRPGRTNINQISELEIPPPSIDKPSTSSQDTQHKEDYIITNPQPKLKLFLRGPNLIGVENVEIDLNNNPKSTIFQAVQDLIQGSQFGNKQDKLKRIWEPTYTIVYKEDREGKGKENEEKEIDALGQPCTVDDVINLLRNLYSLSSPAHAKNDDSAFITQTKGFYIAPEEFISKKITNKLSQQLQDPLTLASRALPTWCHHLTYSAPMLFPFDTRHLYFMCTAFGTSRSIVWLQNQRDLSVERNRSSRRDDTEFRLGRLKHERVKVPRNNLLEWAIQLMNIHSGHKTVLEIEFIGEDGTGLGPTLEFYALCAGELQRKDLAIWLCDDQLDSNRTDPIVFDENTSVKPRPPGYYVSRPTGLFPAPIPQESSVCEKACRYFKFLGIFIAKVLQDGRIVDFPFSKPFFKLLCAGEFGSEVRERTKNSSDRVATPNSEESDLMVSSYISQESEKEMEFLDQPKYRYAADKPWYSGILTIEDLMEIDPARAKFLQQLNELASQKRHILHENTLSEADKIRQIQNLALPPLSSNDTTIVRLEDLALNFVYSPSSTVYGYSDYDLIPRGELEDVTIENVEDYIELLLDWQLNIGINKQLLSFKEGFDLVFPFEKLGAFSPDEIRLMLCGEQNPTWTREDILNYSEPKLGYTKESPGFQRFVNVMMSLTGEERKSFLQFTTGCSCLPPGGLANLHPHLTIVRKVDSVEGYPSVNTCVHYLKLPEYPSEEMMKERLLGAFNEKGFHLN